MKRTIISLIVCLSVVRVFADDAANDLGNDKAKASYAVGVLLGNNFQQQGLEVDPEVLARALQQVQSGEKTEMTPQEAQMFMRQYTQSLGAKMAEKNKAEGDAFLAKNKSAKGVETLPDGLQYKVLTEGTGETPTAGDTVTVNYSGTFLNGKEFDSSYKRGEPATFPVTGVIRGWTEALEKMKVGSKWELYVPADLAYGERGRPGIPPNSTLIFQVELLSIQAPPPASSSAQPRQPLTSDIIKVPSAEEMKKGARIETIPAKDLDKMQTTNSAGK
ncbi:MAG TPA: FKBP-type peptidyl-prolyl cis-trans isomerase [Verrucomicrobiae bacterium]|nr:FKBP-type peptidyl-prolyl cis-trans isomerase [Verrucomicrobiae bacterium]